MWALIDYIPSAQQAAVLDGTSTVDLTSSVQTALNTGKVITLPPNGKVCISSSLLVPANGGFTGDGSFLFFMLGSGFNNSSNVFANSYGSHAVGILCAGGNSSPFTPKANPTLEGFKITTDAPDGRWLRPAVFSNCTNITARNIEIYGFQGAWSGITIDSCVGGVVEQCHIHDCTTNDATFGNSQLTAIEIDNGRVNSIDSRRLRIVDNQVHDITVGSTFLAAHGYQTDGINLNGLGGVGLIVSGNTISNVGEGIDHFGTGATISGNTITDCYLWGVKMIHGPYRTVVQGNTIARCGYDCILIAAADTGKHASGNIIADNVCYDPDPNGINSTHEPACIRVDDVTVAPTLNLIDGNSLDPGQHGAWCVTDVSGGVGNVGSNMLVAAGTLGWIKTHDNNRYRPAIRTAFRASRTSNQTIASLTLVTVLFATEIFDDRGEYDPSTGIWTCQVKGLYQFQSQVKLTLEPGKTVYLGCILTVGGTASTYSNSEYTNPGGSSVPVTIFTSDIISCDQGNTVKVQVYHQNSGATAIDGSGPTNYFTGAPA